MDKILTLGPSKGRRFLRYVSVVLLLGPVRYAEVQRGRRTRKRNLFASGLLMLSRHQGRLSALEPTQTPPASSSDADSHPGSLSSPKHAFPTDTILVSVLVSSIPDSQ